MAKLCAAAVELAGQRESVAVQREIVKEAHNLIQPDFTGLVLQSEDGRLYRASPVVPEESSALFGEPRQDGVSRHVVDTGRLYIQEDAQADPNVSDSMKSLDIQSILAVPLSYKGKVLGMLWFNSLRKRQFSDHDVNLCTTFAAQAAAALWSISTEEREFSEIQRKLLAGMPQVCRGFRQWQDTQVLVDTIAQAIVSTFGVDVCSVMEYDPQKDLFTARGAAGLKKGSRAYTPPNPRKFKALFLEKRDPTWVPDVEHDKYWQNQRFVKSQGIKSLIAYPLWMENEPLGILFADYRTLKEFDAGERERLDLFAELASTVLREGRMRDRLRKSQERMAKSQFFNWMSLFDTGHRHDVNQWAYSIRQRAGLLRRRIERSTTNELAELIEKDIEVIDTLAAEIRSEPLLPSQPRTDPELLSLYDLLKNAADSVCGPSVQGPSPIEVSCDIKALSRARVWGNPIVLSSALSKLLQNARNAMPMGGRITVSGRSAEPWARVRICDEGQGIPDEIQNKLFKEVIPRRPGDTGYGIGALWAANVIEEYGGGIKIESTGPGGTVILLWLPTGEKSKQ